MKNSLRVAARPVRRFVGTGAWRSCGCAACATVAAALLVAAPPARGDAAAAPAGDAAALAAREADLLAQVRELERSFLRLADLLAATDPQRASVLRSAFNRARDEQVADRVERIVALLAQGQLLQAGSSQQQSIGQLRGLLEMLESGVGERRITDTKREVRAFVGRVSKLIARQRDIEGSTESGARDEDVSERQRAAADETRALGEDLDGFARRLDDRERADRPTPGADGAESAAESGAPARDRPPPLADGEQPPAAADGDRQSAADAMPEEPPIAGDDEASRARRTRQLLEAAERRMRRARDRLDAARRHEARAEQERAVEELESARAELEQILRQAREQEVERLLVQLEARIRGMLRAERGILAGLEKLAAAGGQSPRELQLEAARLGREQTAVATDAGRALAVLRDDGSAVAIPQAMEQVRDDALQSASRLDRGDVGSATSGLVGEIIAGLEEMLAAVEQARREAGAGEDPGGGGAGAEPGEQPLVDALAELKMLRTLQVRINARTRRFAQLIDDGDAPAAEPELRAAVERLADRQRAIETAARDIVAGLPE